MARPLTFDQEAVERFDDVLNAATDSLIDTLERVSRDNMRAEIDRFVEALEQITSCRSTSERLGAGLPANPSR